MEVYLVITTVVLPAYGLYAPRRLILVSGAILNKWFVRDQLIVKWLIMSNGGFREGNLWEGTRPPVALPLRLAKTRYKILSWRSSSWKHAVAPGGDECSQILPPDLQLCYWCRSWHHTKTKAVYCMRRRSTMCTLKSSRVNSSPHWYSPGSHRPTVVMGHIRLKGQRSWWHVLS